VLIPPEGKRREDYGLRADGVGEIRWFDGSLHFSSVDYVHQKDEHLHAVIEQVLNGMGARETADEIKQKE